MGAIELSPARLRVPALGLCTEPGLGLAQIEPRNENIVSLSYRLFFPGKPDP